MSSVLSVVPHSIRRTEEDGFFLLPSAKEGTETHVAKDPKCSGSGQIKAET